MNRLYITCIALFASILCIGQPLFVPDAEIVKVGDILFQKPHTVHIGFTNKGTEPLHLTEVKPACGCTTVKFSTEEVKPGERGEIEATYDAKLLGTFYKEFTLYVDYDSVPHYTAIQGCVVTEVKDYSHDYPINLGNVRLTSNHIDFGDVNEGTKYVTEFGLVNTEHTAFRPELMHLPECLSVECSPEDIPAGQSGIIRLTLDTKKIENLGLTQTSLYLARYMGDKICDENEIKVSCILLPDFSSLTDEQRSNAPVMEVSANRIDMGQMGQKKKASTSVIISNEGHSPLHIKQVQVLDNALNVSLGNRLIKPGKKTKLKIQVLAKNLQEKDYNPRILIVSDDPNHPKEIINIYVAP